MQDLCTPELPHLVLFFTTLNIQKLNFSLSYRKSGHISALNTCKTQPSVRKDSVSQIMSSQALLCLSQVWLKKEKTLILTNFKHDFSRKYLSRLSHFAEKFEVYPYFMYFLQAVYQLFSSSTVLRKIFFFLFSYSCFFPWCLECSWFRLMHVTGIVNWNEGWLHANKNTLLTPCFTHSSSSKWLMEWLEGRFVWMPEIILCCQDPGKAAEKHLPMFTSPCSASNIYCVHFAAV